MGLLGIKKTSLDAKAFYKTAAEVSTFIFSVEQNIGGIGRNSV